jgi:hypothetical protein
MSNHNFTNYNPIVAGQKKRHVPGIGAPDGAGTTLLRALEGLGLLNHSPELHKLVASGTTTVGVLGQQFTVHQLDQALKDTDATTSQKMAFKNNVDRAGLLKKNLY